MKKTRFNEKLTGFDIDGDGVKKIEVDWIFYQEK